MKKLLGIVVLGLLWCNVGFADHGHCGECIEGDCKNGYGAYKCVLEKYAGEFKDGKLHGQGTLTMDLEGKYVGEFKDDKLHGLGTFTYFNGDKYAGEWKDGMRDGQGTFTFQDGSVIKGIFKKNKLVKKLK